MKIFIVSIFLFFPWYVSSQEASDCSQFEIALKSPVVVFWGMQRVFDQALEDYERVFEESQQCQSDCIEINEDLEEKAAILSDAEENLELAEEERQRTLEEYHECKGTLPASDSAESS
ncbi:MAG: hypothetical protein OXB86_00405 [Bdellovibrionales bacterium]|nr:hypothetical protein [Bdellovibrionales bacterium]